MPLITDAEEARALYRHAAERRACLLAACTENLTTTEAILRAAAEAGEQTGLREPPVVISFTGNYPPRPQLVLYTSLGDTKEGFLAARDDILRLTRKDGPYGHLKVMVHLDHAHPDRDSKIIEEGTGFFASVMYDCSHLPLQENAARTRDFVQKLHNQVVIEGAVDEISEANGPDGAPGPELTCADTVSDYVSRTGVDLVVCNLGTEHRSTGVTACYEGAKARRISSDVGRILVLHGTSSLADDDMARLADDGVVKANVWTRIEATGGQALALDVVRNLGRILSNAQLERLREERVITPDFTAAWGGESPKIGIMTETHRRYHVWTPAVVEVLKKCMINLGLGHLAPGAQGA